MFSHHRNHVKEASALRLKAPGDKKNHVDRTCQVEWRGGVLRRLPTNVLRWTQKLGQADFVRFSHLEGEHLWISQMTESLQIVLTTDFLETRWIVKERQLTIWA